jgi:hypothetical protein
MNTFAVHIHGEPYLWGSYEPVCVDGSFVGE